MLFYLKTPILFSKKDKQKPVCQSPFPQILMHKHVKIILLLSEKINKILPPKQTPSSLDQPITFANFSIFSIRILLYIILLYQCYVIRNCKGIYYHCLQNILSQTPPLPSSKSVHINIFQADNFEMLKVYGINIFPIDPAN